MPAPSVSRLVHQFETRRPRTRSSGARASNTGRPSTIASGRAQRGLHEGRDQVGRVLAVGVHRQRVREAGRARGAAGRAARPRPCRRCAGSTNTRRPGSAAAIARRPSARAVGAAVDHHPHRVPLRARGAHRLVDLGAGVVAGDQHQVAWSMPAHALMRAQLARRSRPRAASAGPGGRPRGAKRWPSRTREHDRKRRQAPDRPALAEVGRVGVDEDGLDRHLRHAARSA